MRFSPTFPSSRRLPAFLLIPRSSRTAWPPRRHVSFCYSGRGWAAQAIVLNEFCSFNVRRRVEIYQLDRRR
jgi:hypothetical protein